MQFGTRPLSAPHLPLTYHCLTSRPLKTLASEGRSYGGLELRWTDCLVSEAAICLGGLSSFIMLRFLFTTFNESSLVSSPQAPAACIAPDVLVLQVRTRKDGLSQMQVPAGNRVAALRGEKEKNYLSFPSVDVKASDGSTASSFLRFCQRTSEFKDADGGFGWLVGKQGDKKWST